MPIASSLMENALPTPFPVPQPLPPGLDRTAIAAHPALRAVLKVQAGAFLAVHRQIPRIAAIFGTQQRYLLAQLATAMAFERGERGLVVAHFLEAVKEHAIASRNTAISFVEEMLHYRMAQAGPAGADRRSRPVVLAGSTVAALETWLALHLESLDALDGGSRRATLRRDPGLLAQMHPRIVRQLLSSKTTMQPARILALFSDMNDGGLLMDKIIASLDDAPAGAERFPTRIRSFGQLSEPLRITRTHLLRKLAASERAAHVGWSAKRGASIFWISRDFLTEYEAYQIDKLACIEAAWQAAAA